MRASRRTVIGLAACAAIVASPRGAFAAKLTDISIALGATGMGSVTPRLVKEMGLYEKHGINASLITMDSGSAAVTAMLSGTVQAALGGTSDVIVAQGRGQAAVIVLNTYKGASGTLVLANKAIEKLGISPTDPIERRLKALDGMLVATASATSPYTVILKTAATQAGANIHFTYMAPASMPSALQAGAVQGLLAAAPTWIPTVVQGMGKIWISGPGGEYPSDYVPVSATSLEVMRAFADANRDVVSRLISAHDDFIKAIDQRPADVKAALAKVYSAFDAAAIDLLFSSEIKVLKGGPMTVGDLKHDIALVKSSGIELPGIEHADLSSLIFQ